VITFVVAALMASQATAAPPQEDPVEPYTQSNANAGARQFEGQGMLDAFHGKDGIARVVDGMVDRNIADPRISDIFKGQDLVRLRRTLKEQFCYILNGGCDYSGREMKSSHKDLGLQTADFNALVENLQAAMRDENVPYFAQNRMLAKLAPMKRDTVVR
jgi:hemoglobin